MTITTIDAAAQAAIGAAARELHLPTVRAEAGRIAEAAARERLSHGAFLAEVLTAECDDRDARRRIRRVSEAKFPRSKRLTDFDHTALPDLPAATLAELADGAWIDRRRTRRAARRLRHRQDPPAHRPRHRRRRARPPSPLHHHRRTGQRTRRSR